MLESKQHIMKKIGTLLLLALSFTSCINDVTLNDPAFATYINGTYKQAKQASISLNGNGGLVLTASFDEGILTINTTDVIIGTYFAGSQDQSTFSSYLGINGAFTSQAVGGPAYLTSLITPGSGYSNATNVLTTGGSGSGLLLDIEANTNGEIIDYTVVARGSNYLAGDIVTVDLGNQNAEIEVINVQQSNGVINITNYENGLYTGTFSLNLTDDDGNTTTFSDGNFYRIPLK